jgi:hypothetical protein
MGIKEYLRENKKQMATDTKGTVMAYNILNLLSLESLDQTIKDIHSKLKPAQLLMTNYPTSPRVSKLDAKDIEDKLKKIFRTVIVVGGTKGAPFWRCEK